VLAIKPALFLYGGEWEFVVVCSVGWWRGSDLCGWWWENVGESGGI